MGEAAIQAPGIWGEQKEERNNGKWATDHNVPSKVHSEVVISE
jgi:hypothetical protein